ncbi:MAG: hypothetical protein SV375_21855 [Thermodesulfobacteriota bacterium]|nr:hypothetical protein [Thermodesulfobacteriota bacterium]
MDLKIFAETNLFNAGTSFFKQLNIRLNSNTSTSLDIRDILKDGFKEDDIYLQVTETYFLGLVDNSVFDDNLSLSDKNSLSFEDASKKIHADYEGLMVFAVKIDGNDSPARTQISDLTRAFNRASQNIPVVLLLRYGACLSLATSERTTYKQAWRQGEKIGKVSLLKDIDTQNPHTGHLRNHAKRSDLR